MKLSVIVPTTSDMEILGPTLKHLKAALASVDAEVIVVDDSREGILKLNENGVTVLHSFGQGASAARNMGWRHAQSVLLLFLDDDILIRDIHIQRTLSLHQEESPTAYNFAWVYPEELRCSMQASKIGRYMEARQMYSIEHRLHKSLDSLPALMPETGLSSQYLSIEKKWMEKVNGYDRIPFAGVEDSLLFKKLEGIGVNVFLSTRDVVEQNESKRVAIDKLYRRYRTGALTRRVAFSMGHNELGVGMKIGGRLKGELGILVLPLLRSMEFVLPYSWSYQKVVNWILYTGTYRGFYKDALPSHFAK